MNHLSVSDVENLVNKRFEGKKRLVHVQGVARLAKELAHKFNLDEDKAYIAGLLHDWSKYDTIEQMCADINDPTIVEKFKDAPQIYHAYASANCAKRLGIDDEEIINAIRYHVYGRIGMSLLEKILVIADFCEDSREYEVCKTCRKVLDSGHFNEAMVMCIESTINAVIKAGYKPIEEEYEILKELKGEC